MNLKLIVIPCYLIGSYLIAISLFGKPPASNLLFGFVLLAAGLFLSRRIAAVGLSGRSSSEPPSVPADFGATHWHKNIALNANTRKLWLRDEDGRTRIFSPGEITGWGVESKEASKGFIAGNMVVNNAIRMHAYSKLLIKTRDLDHPTWRVKFNAHSDHFASGGNRNWNELQQWSDRLGAFFEPQG